MGYGFAGFGILGSMILGGGGGGLGLLFKDLGPRGLGSNAAAFYNELEMTAGDVGL